MKSTLRALSLSACAFSTALFVAAPAEARISIDALGGEVEIEGYLSSEARARVGAGESYLTQWIQRLQVEASANYRDVGIFDELSFVTIVRPEFDAGYYYGDSIGSGRGRNADTPSYLGSRFNNSTDPVGFGGFDYLLQGAGSPADPNAPIFTTGGLSKFVTEGFQNPGWLNNFEATLGKTPRGAEFNFVQGAGAGINQLDSGFPLLVPMNQMELNCKRCLNLDNDPLDVAMAAGDSNRRIYPFRELYMDAVINDWWIRVGKQQIVWGKTDFFRLQDIVNPIDFGQHFFFDSFEDIRIPQWMASIQYKAGDIGPLTDTAVQLVWNFDQFEPVGLGNPTAPWAHPFAKEIATFAAFNEFFSVEPCVSASTAFGGGPFGGMTADDVCGARGPLDDRKPSGFGQPVGTSRWDRPDWDIDNTEAGMRFEFRVGEFHVALSHFYGWNDAPVVTFHSMNVPTGLLGTNAGVGTADRLIFDLALDRGLGVGGIPIQVTTPDQGLQAIAGGGSLAPLVDPLTGVATPASVLAQRALAQDNAELFYRTGAILGGQTHIAHKQSHTTGLSFDYFESYTGVVVRVESSITVDELVNNTLKPNWEDESDVMRWSVGFDRPTWIKWLNPTRTFFLSAQIFDTWYIDHEGDKHTGYFVDEHNFITTFFFIGNYMRDKLKPVGFAVWEEASNSFVAGLNLEWLIDNHWSVKGGMHTIWEGDENYRHDSGPFTSFIVPGSCSEPGSRRGGTCYDPYQQSVFGVAHEGIGALRDNDEVFLQLKYQF